ncbi:hypothetical protein KSB_62120 [Ktedonobacter robiniae]|uniref:Uncharacterized protein n=1 Tax=Ktedonobacter robiniae TaxID=2778365 RepID=A0ABQ3UYV2_9CHLR|nr:hypothetical protein KSB_62120 [Ktedonobacter robiniae]
MSGHMLTTFKGIWSTAWGPRVENVIRFSLKTLLEANRTLVQMDPHRGPEQQYTLLDLTVLLNKQSFRARVLDLVEPCGRRCLRTPIISLSLRSPEKMPTCCDMNYGIS